MPLEKCAGAVIFTQHHFAKKLSKKQNAKNGAGFRRDGNKIYYLLLNYAAIGKVEKTYWGFSKGHIEKGEKEMDAIIREIKEETGIEDLEFLEGFKEAEKYFFKYKEKTIFKRVYYLLAETKIKEIKLSLEHLGFKWLPYKKALEKLSFKNAKRILKKANEFLNQKETRSKI